jgi:arsenate reductase
MTRPGVLFVCTGNSARSQMAEAFLRKHAAEQFQAYSAGTQPTQRHPLSVCVMDEIGIDMRGHRAKHILEYLGRAPIRVLIVVCFEAEQACPAIWPGGISRHFWRLEDPVACAGNEEERLGKFRAVRDQIEQKVLDWLAHVTQPAVPHD